MFETEYRVMGLGAPNKPRASEWFNDFKLTYPLAEPNGQPRGHAGLMPTERVEYLCSRQLNEDALIHYGGSRADKNLLEWELSLRAI